MQLLLLQNQGCSPFWTRIGYSEQFQSVKSKALLTTDIFVSRGYSRKYTKMDNTWNSGGSSGDDDTRLSGHIDHTDTNNPGYTWPTAVDHEDHATYYKLEHPVADVEDLFGTEYLQYLLRKQNTGKDNPPKNWGSIDDDESERSFDTAAIEITSHIIDNSVDELTTDEIPISDGYVRALVLQQVRGLNFDEFADHVSQYPWLQSKLELGKFVTDTSFSLRYTRGCHSSTSEVQRYSS